MLGGLLRVPQLGSVPSSPEVIDQIDTCSDQPELNLQLGFPVGEERILRRDDIDVAVQSVPVPGDGQLHLMLRRDRGAVLLPRLLGKNPKARKG